MASPWRQKGVWRKFGLNALRRRCFKSKARARSNKHGLSERQPNGRNAKNAWSLETGRGVAAGLNQPRWVTHHASCWSLA
jgi:hypothetical protein